MAVATTARPSVKLRANAAKVRDVFDTYGVSNVRVFGSVARGDDHPGSDVDFLIEIPETLHLLNFGVFREELERAIGAPVDVMGDLTTGKPADRARESALSLEQVLSRD